MLHWTTLRHRVDVNHDPHVPRASLTSYPRIKPRVVNTSLEASQACALLAGTRFCGSHDHAIISSTSYAGLAPRTVLHIHRTLSKALKQATDDGLIPRNAAASVKPPRPCSEEMQPLSKDQVRTFLDTVRGDRMEAIYVLVVAAGLRQGELLALKWEGVDLEGANPTLEVRRSLSETRGRRSFVTPKRAVADGISGSLGGP